MAVDVLSILRLGFSLSIVVSLSLIDCKPAHDFELFMQEKNYSFLNEGNLFVEGRRDIERYQIPSKHLNETTNTSTHETKRGFSFVDIVESVFSVVANGFGSLMTSIIGTEKSSKPRSNRVSYKNYQLIRLYPNTETHAKDLKELMDSEPEYIKFWTMPMNNKTTDVVVSPDLVSDVKTFLRSKGIDFTVLISDLQKTIAHQNPKMSKEQREDLVNTHGHSMTWKRYHRYGDIARYMDYLAFRYPSLVELITIGHSYEGQPIKMVKISSGLAKDGYDKPAIWIDAGMHAREWISSAVATYIMSQLVEKNTSYSKLLDNADWMILPVANPDGYEFTHIGDRLWRKTRSNHGDDQDDSRQSHSSLLQLVSHYTRWFWGKCEGVDPNRNFGYHWGEVEEGGASLDPCHETYAGPHAFSEPETKAMAEYILTNKQSIRMYLTLHSYSQMWLVPWGYTHSKPSDYSELMGAARKAVGAISKVHGTNYQLGPSADLLYPTSGMITECLG
ncbi:carboxypeptidase A2 isoform X2 [Megachile rotundata]|uniref:carboxypeptidase A2 isoform X2 n=1 Tax=Megachile rotundata TaxID=143995 RepID=UPI003FD248E0